MQKYKNAKIQKHKNAKIQTSTEYKKILHMCRRGGEEGGGGVGVVAPQQGQVARGGDVGAI